MKEHLAADPSFRAMVEALHVLAGPPYLTTLDRKIIARAALAALLGKETT